jgi:hypothetical protein
MRRSEETRFVRAAREALGPPLTRPTGWPQQIEAALLDAVLSIRATYGRPGTGVRACIERWREHRQGATLDDLTALRTLGPDTLADVLRSRQRLSGDALTTAGILQVTDRLLDLGVRHASDLRADSPEHRAAVTGVVGLGPLTWGYLLIVLAADDRPADPRLLQFAARAVDAEVSDAALGVLLDRAAQRLQVPVTTLELALWRAEGRARNASSPATAAG